MQTAQGEKYNYLEKEGDGFLQPNLFVLNFNFMKTFFVGYL